MKKLIITAIIFSSFVFSANYENSMLFKNERSLGMGGTGVATGGKAPLVFLNPAGLSKMATDGGIDFSLLDVNLGANDAIAKKYLAGEIDTNDMPALIAAVLGENINLDLNSYNYLAAKIGMVTASVGIFESSNTNMQIHSGFGPAGLLELDTKTYLGANLSSSFSVANSVHLGIGAKYIVSHARNKVLGLGDVMASDFTDTLITDITPTIQTVKDSAGATLDFGAIYDLDDIRRVSGSRLLNRLLDATNPSIGVSVLNIGGYLTSSDVAYIPQTINTGVTLRPYCTWFRELVVSAELHDILNGYDINKSRGIYGQFRAGFEGYLIKNILMDLSLRGGWLNGAYSAGVNTRIAFLHIGATTYVEEMGGYIGQAPDRRYLINLGVKF
jgi:hypothetical protein